MKRFLPKLTASLLGIGVGLLLIVLGAVAFYQTRVLPKTYVAGVSIGGMTVEDAQTTITQATQQVEDKPLRITYQSQTITETPAEIGIKVASSNASNYSFSPDELLHQSFWVNLFSIKEVSLAYASNQETLAGFLSTKFNLSDQPVNATLTVSNGELDVVPGITGEALDTTPVISAISSGTTGPIVLTASPTNPAITTETADQTKTDIINSIEPLTLTNNNQALMIPVGDIYNFIDFTVSGKTINWQIDKNKVTSYVGSKIAPKVNVAMVQTITQTQPNNTTITTPGSPGTKVDTTALTSSILSAIANKSTTNIQLPTSAIAVTSKVVGPNYIAGMFPGLYVYVNLASQMMYILNGATVAQTFETSTGAGNTPTPPGQYYIYNKLPMPRSPLYNALWMPDWNGISTSGTAATAEGYGIHALPCFDITCRYVEGSRDLGVPVSHGCIRLSAVNALWFYTNIPIGTPVYVAKN